MHKKYNENRGQTLDKFQPRISTNWQYQPDRPVDLNNTFMSQNGIPLKQFNHNDQNNPFENHNQIESTRNNGTYDPDGTSTSDRNSQYYEDQNVDYDEDIRERQCRVHSLHRNKTFTTRSKTEMPKVREARTGGAKKYKGEVNSSLLENHADLIVAKMEKDENLMEDTPNSEGLRRNALREMPQCLTIKRRVKSKLIKSVSKKSKRKPIGCIKAMRYRMGINFSKFKESLKNLAYMFELWYQPLKQIEGEFGSDVASYFKFLRWIFIVNVIIMVPCFCFIVLPQLIYGQTNNVHTALKPEDILTGDGYFTNTALYYGYYSNESVSLSSSLTYSMPDAYFITNLCIYVFAFIVVALSTARSYKESYIETQGGLKNVFAQKIFCGWDYGIATENAAKLKSSAMYHELKVLLLEANKTEYKPTFWKQFFSIFEILVVNIFLISSFVGIGLGLWRLMEMPESHSFLIAVTVNLIISIYPFLFTAIAKLENYRNPKKTLYITLFRTFALGLVIIGVFVTYWLKNSKELCWETYLGQEIYRLSLFDFIFSHVIDIAVFMIYRMFKVNPDFDISRHTMQIIYNQTLLWVGLVFSPLLSLIVVIKLWITWYLRQVMVLKFYKPSSKISRAAQNQTFFMIMVFLSLVLICSLHGYILTNHPTSKDCGPLRDFTYSYELITNGILNIEENNKYVKLILLIRKPGSITLVFIGLSILVYYLKEKADSQKLLINNYREMLAWAAKDKEYVINNINVLTNNKWNLDIPNDIHFDPVSSIPKSPKRRQNNSDYLENNSDGKPLL